VHLNATWEPIYWLTNDPKLVKSDNRRVLQAHSERQVKLIRDGGESRTASFSDGAYRLRKGSFSNPTEGRIHRNVLSYGHRCADQSAARKFARSVGLPEHGATMPLALADVLVRFLTEEGDLMVDPFAGWNTSAMAAEINGCRWLTTERAGEYVLGGGARFTRCAGYRSFGQVAPVAMR
jgi:DNA modification methylase